MCGQVSHSVLPPGADSCRQQLPGGCLHQSGLPCLLPILLTVGNPPNPPPNPPFPGSGLFFSFLFFLQIKFQAFLPCTFFQIMETKSVQ